eukprot:15453346-Heterocapsa_arctica.AAC.1
MEKCKELEGIMDMVVYLENKTRFKNMEDIRVEKEMEDTPAMNNDLNNAITTLNMRIDKFIEVTEKRMEETLHITRETREICKQMLEEANGTKEDAELMDEEKNKKDKKDKEYKKAAEAHLRRRQRRKLRQRRKRRTRRTML